MDRENSNIKAIILAGQRDFGRCPIASRLPRAYWPLAGATVLEVLIRNLWEQGIADVQVCVNQNGFGIETREFPGIRVNLIREKLPLGTGGCLRDAAGADPDGLMLVIQGNLIFPPDLSRMIAAHRQSGSLLTVALHQPDEDAPDLEAAGIYLASPEIIAHIPEKGYVDIKEGLIPSLLRQGLNIHTWRLERPAGNFHDWAEYLRYSLDYLATPSPPSPANPAKNSRQRIAPDARIHPEAQLSGPMVIESGAVIEAGARIIGPASIGPGVRVEAGARVAYSILWRHSIVGKQAEVQGCLVDETIKIPAKTRATARLFPLSQARAVLTPAGYAARQPIQAKIRAAAISPGKFLLDRSAALVRQPLLARKNFQVAAWLVLLLAFVASYWSTLAELWDIWMKSDEFSSGLLVPPIIAYLIWSGRKTIFQDGLEPHGAGLFVFFAGQALRVMGLFLMFDSAIRLSLVISLAGLVLYLCGWRTFRRLLPFAIFLLLMLPFPKRVQQGLTAPLQTWATTSAVYLLEMLGYSVIREGNLIHIKGVVIAIAEACNGLRMVTAFFVITGLIVLLINRPRWEKLVLILSALPIALICNTLRLAFTAIIFTQVRDPQWDEVFHDYGGYAMMPLAVALIMFELWVMSRILVAPPAASQEAILVPRRRRANAGGWDHAQPTTTSQASVFFRGCSSVE